MTTKYWLGEVKGEACPLGHRMVDENVTTARSRYGPKLYRKCLTCRRTANRTAEARRRQTLSQVRFEIDPALHAAVRKDIKKSGLTAVGWWNAVAAAALIFRNGPFTPDGVVR